VLLPPVDEPGLAWEHAALAGLAQHLPFVHVPEPSAAGTTWIRIGERHAWVMPLVDGAPADPGREPHRLAAARALGRVHAAGALLDVPGRPGAPPLPDVEWPAPAVPRELREWETVIAEGRAWATDWVARTASERRPRSGLVHGDFFPGNVLVDDDTVTAVIDWEESRLDWLSWDLANAIGTFCTAGDELDAVAARAFLAAYRDAGGTAPPGERDLLVPLMRVKRIMEVLRAPGDREPRWAHQRHNLRALEHTRTLIG
jgi:Ser/Thr protein kinase RdoA (MazF antagonist)